MAVKYKTASAAYKDLGHKILEAIYNMEEKGVDEEFHYAATVTVTINNNGRITYKQPRGLDKDSALGKAVKIQARADLEVIRNRGIKFLLNSTENPNDRAIRQAHSQLRVAVK